MRTLEEVREKMRQECINKINTMNQNIEFTRDDDVIDYWNELIKEQRQRLIIINNK